MREELEGMRGGQLWSVREARPEPLRGAYAAQLSQPARRFLVGTLEGVVVGFAVGEVEELRDGRRLGIVRDLFVEPPAREVGVGEAMIGELLAFFVAEGCAGVDA